jgi:hypothetical protein
LKDNSFWAEIYKLFRGIFLNNNFEKKMEIIFGNIFGYNFGNYFWKAEFWKYFWGIVFGI